MRGKLFFILFGGLIVALMATIGGVMLDRLGSAEDTIHGLQRELSLMRGEFTDTVDWKLEDVREGLFAELNRQNANAFEVSYTVTEYSGPERLAYVSARFALKRYEPGAPVNVVVTGADVGASTTPAALENGYFIAHLTLHLGPVDDPAVYNLSYQMTAPDGAVAGEPLAKIIPYNSLFDRILGSGVMVDPPVYDRAKSRETVTMRAFLLNDYKSRPDMRFVNCTLEILYDGRTLETLDMMEHMTEQGGIQQLNQVEIARTYPDAALRRPEGQEGAFTLYEARLHAMDGYGFAYDFT